MEHRTCDQCCATAKVYYDLGHGQELAYCGHHSNINLAALTKNAHVIVDMRHTLETHT